MNDRMRIGANFGALARRSALRCLFPLALLSAPLHSPAADLGGSVRDGDGKPVSGAMITLTSSDGLFAETVYSDGDGKFHLATAQSGSLSLRVRRPPYHDVTRTVDLGTTSAEVEFTLSPMTDPRAISDTLTASAHFARLEFPDPVQKQWFQVECMTCHQIGNAYTRQPRSLERWRQILQRMLGFYGVKDQDWINRYAGILAEGFDGTPTRVQQAYPVDPAIFPARVLQWKLPGAIVAHDVELRTADGKFYTVDQGSDRIFITDPVTRETEIFEIPDGGIPIGGKFFTTMGDRNPVGLSVPRAPHSLKEGPDGHFYTTESLSGMIGEFDPETRSYTAHDVGKGAMYPHTLRFDGNRVWFTISFSNQVGMLDIGTGEMTVIDLPPDRDRPEMPAYVPYGIDIHPLDGSVWYSSLMGNRIGRIDPETLEVRSFRPPVVGPRRLRFAADGTLWIPDYGRGRLVKMNTATEEYESYVIPPLSPGEVEAPYALGIHPRTQEIWITANMSDRMFRFFPKEGRFVSYPLPTRGTFLRDIIFTPEGLVCAASSPIPAPLVVEGGLQEILCLDPVGDLPLPEPAG